MMLPFHKRLAEIGLAAIEDFGFVLAGGYALSANDVGDRPSDDVDLFTNTLSQDRFAAACECLVDALVKNGLTVTVTRRGSTFLDVTARDEETGDTSAIQLGVNYREFPPQRIAVGPVLDLRDAVASKCQLCGRAATFVTSSTSTRFACPAGSPTRKSSNWPTSRRPVRWTDAGLPTGFGWRRRDRSRTTPFTTSTPPAGQRSRPVRALGGRHRLGRLVVCRA